MNKISPLVRVPLLYGLMAGVLGGAICIALYYIGKHPLLFPIYFDFRIVLFGLFMFFTLKEYRDHYMGGVLYFWQGVIMCVLMVTVFAIIAGLILYGFGKFEPKYVTSFITLYTDQVKNFPKEVVDGIGKENIDRNLEALKSTNSYELAKNYFSQSYFLSFFLTIILSVILRKQPKN